MRLGKKVRTQGPSEGQRTSFGDSYIPEEEIIDSIVVNTLNGISTTKKGVEIDDNEFQEAHGFYNRDGRLLAVPFPTTLTPTKPNSNRILGLFNINRFSGVSTHLRFTKSSVHRLNGAAWTAITGAALVGADYDRFQLVFIEDRAFFNNNGLDVLQEINLAADTYAAAGNARKYKYYTAINNRIIGANLRAAINDPTEVAGCGDRNYTQWDPATDISAFRTSLIEPELNSIDDITGLMNADNNLMVLRSRSIWLGIPQPVASTPFNFIKIDHRGCNAPYSIQHVRNGIMWYDPYLQNVFYYDFARKEIAPVGEKIKRTLGSTIGDVSRVFSSFDDYNNEYELCVELSGIGGARIFRLSLDSGTWITHDVLLACCVSNNVASIPSTTIDGLGSTPIDSLVGTIDNLSSDAIIASKIFGTVDGERKQLTNAFLSTTRLTSKVFRIPGMKQRIDRIELDFERMGPVKIFFRFTEKSSVGTNIKTFGLENIVGDARYPTVKIPINRICEEFAFVIETSSDDNSWIYNLLAFRLFRYPAGRL